MDKVLSRIQKLFALADGDSEEARTAASLAVRLIKEHQVALSMPNPPKTAPPFTTSYTSVKPPPGYEDLAALYRAWGMASPWGSNPDWPHQRARPAAAKDDDERDPFDFTAAEAAAKNGTR
jgi:hypothetical protein